MKRSLVVLCSVVGVVSWPALSLACSGPSAAEVIAANQRAGLLLFLAGAVAAVHLGLRFRAHPKKGVWIGGLALLSFLHPIWWLGAMSGDCGYLLLYSSVVVGIVQAAIVVAGHVRLRRVQGSGPDHDSGGSQDVQDVAQPTKLSSQEAERLVDMVGHAPDRQAAMAAAEKAFAFLVGQLHLLGEKANGYPKNPIAGDVWQEGHNLAKACDRFADAISHWDAKRGEEQATRLAASLAMQVVAHYPQEIFPRVLRNAKCCESLGMLKEAIAAYSCIIDDFSALDLEELLDGSEPLEGSQVVILAALREALRAVQRISPQHLTPSQLALSEKISAVFGE